MNPGRSSSRRARLWLPAAGVAVVAIAFVAVIAAVLVSPGGDSEIADTAKLPQPSEGANIVGSESALITMVEYSDFQ